MNSASILKYSAYDRSGVVAPKKPQPRNHGKPWHQSCKPEPSINHKALLPTSVYFPNVTPAPTLKTLASIRSNRDALASADLQAGISDLRRMGVLTGYGGREVIHGSGRPSTTGGLGTVSQQARNGYARKPNGGFYC